MIIARLERPLERPPTHYEPPACFPEQSITLKTVKTWDFINTSKGCDFILLPYSIFEIKTFFRSEKVDNEANEITEEQNETNEESKPITSKKHHSSSGSSSKSSRTNNDNLSG